jgi:hypothetical protein
MKSVNKGAYMSKEKNVTEKECVRSTGKTDATDVISAYIDNLKKEIVSIERKKAIVEPEELPALDKSIRRLKRHLQLAETCIEPEESKMLDEISESKIFLNKLYADIAKQEVDFNDTSNYLLISARRLEDSIERLALLADLSDGEEALPFPNWNEFMKPLYAHVAAKKRRKDHVVERIHETEQEIKKIEYNLQEAKKRNDIEKIVMYSDQLEDAKNKRRYVLPLIEEVENSKTFPDGEIAKTWKAVCDIYGREWRNRLEAVRRAAQLYHKGIQELKELDNELRMVRANIQSLGKQEGSEEQIIRYSPIISNNVSVDSINLMGRDENEILNNLIFFPRDQML